MANEISIVVRVQNQASRGFGQIGQAATGMNSAIESASSALDGLDAVMQSGADKAAKRAQTQNDVNQAMLDSKQAAQDLKQATIDANQAELDATAAQDDYNEAVKKFGANSEEAKQAQADLSQAQADSTQATNDMEQAGIDAAQAQIDLNAAQKELNPTFVQQASQKFQELAPMIGLASLAAGQAAGGISRLGLVTKITSAATKTWTVVQKGLNLVMRMNPIGLIITAIVLLVGALILAYKKSDTFRAVVNKAFAMVKSGAKALWEGIKNAFEKVKGAFQTLVGWGKWLWNKMKEYFFKLVLAVSPFVQGVKNAIRNVRDRFGSIVDYVKRIPGRFSSAFGRLYTIITSPVRNAVSAVKSWLTGLLDFAKGIPGKIGGAVKSAIPGFAHGGVVGQAASGGGRSGLTMTGEHGPELLRLPPGTQVRSNPDTRRAFAGQGGGSGGVYTIVIEGTGVLKGLREVVRIKGGNVQKVLGA